MDPSILWIARIADESFGVGSLLQPGGSYSAVIHLRWGSRVTRPKHPDKNIEAVLQEAEDHGWTVKKAKGAAYYKVLCFCGRHAKWSIHATPSTSDYAKNLAAWFHRQECW